MLLLIVALTGLLQLVVVVEAFAPKVDAAVLLDLGQEVGARLGVFVVRI